MLYQLSYAGRLGMERETGIEPATNRLEICDSTIELLPQVHLILPRVASLCTFPYSRVCTAMTEFPVLNALMFTGLGVLVFIAAFAIVAKLAPFNLWKEIVQERNVAAAILAGAVALGLCWIIAATMH